MNVLHKSLLMQDWVFRLGTKPNSGLLTLNSNIVTRAPKLGEIPSVGAFLKSAQVKTAAKDLHVNSFCGGVKYALSVQWPSVTILEQNLGCTLGT